MPELFLLLSILLLLVYGASRVYTNASVLKDSLCHRHPLRGQENYRGVVLLFKNSFLFTVLSLVGTLFLLIIQLPVLQSFLKTADIPVGSVQSGFITHPEVLNGFLVISPLSIIIKIVSLTSALVVMGFFLQPFSTQIVALRSSFKGSFTKSAAGIPLGKIKPSRGYHYPDFEYLLLICLVLLGIFLLISCRDLLLFYLSIEIISLSLYVLATIRRESSFGLSGQYSTEAGLKYFLLGAVSSGFLLFGCAVIYLSSGLINLDEIRLAYFISTIEFGGVHEASLNIHDVIKPVGLEIGIFFVVVALLFKLAAGPFHM